MGELAIELSSNSVKRQKIEEEINVCPYYSIYKNQQNESLIAKLLLHVVRGEETQAEAMLVSNHKLLLESSITVDYSGRIVEGTPFRLALAAEDTQMCAMMKKYFALLRDENNKTIGTAEMLKQFNEQYPIGVGNVLCDFDFKTLAAEITADPFVNLKPNANTKEKLEKFYDHFTPVNKMINKTGRHFNILDLILGVQTYIENNTIWTHTQNAFYWKRVVGHLQRLVPACLAQSLCEGIEDVAYNKKSLQRNLNLDQDNVYYPLDQNINWRLGEHYAVYGNDSRTLLETPMTGYESMKLLKITLRAFRDYGMLKYLELAELRRELEVSNNNLCIIQRNKY